MAIPGWLWPDDRSSTGSTQGPRKSLGASEIEHATSVFSVLSSPIRLQILVTLHERSVPVSYTELRESASVDDKGKFNYHLRRLDHLVCVQDGEYMLTDRGGEFIQEALYNGLILDNE
ncbi:DUF7347 domain-containing protein [Natrinema altunense]|nr:ArsR family transcriptional regulator [Natrinema altunense]